MLAEGTANLSKEFSFRLQETKWSQPVTFKVANLSF